MWNQLPFWYFWVEGEKICITFARRCNVLDKYVISCKLKNVIFWLSLLPDGEGSVEGYKDVLGTGAALI